MNILVLNGSPRAKGNTAQMISAFRKGAEAADHRVNVEDVCEKQIRGCMARDYRHSKGKGSCVQKDDMPQIYAMFRDAEFQSFGASLY